MNPDCPTERSGAQGAPGALLPPPVLPKRHGHLILDLGPCLCVGHPSSTFCSQRQPDRKGIPRKHRAHLELGPYLPSLCPCQHILHPSRPPWNSQVPGWLPPWGSRPRAWPGVWRWERALWRLGRGRWGLPGSLILGKLRLPEMPARQDLFFITTIDYPEEEEGKKHSTTTKQPPNFLLLESAVHGRLAVHY